MFVFVIPLYRQRSRTVAPKFIITRLRQINNEASSEPLSRKRRIDDDVHVIRYASNEEGGDCV